MPDALRSLPSDTQPMMDQIHTQRVGRLLPLLCGVALIVSIGLTFASYRLFEAAIRIRWHVGTYYHLGPETIPTTTLAVVPGIVLLSCLAAWLVSSATRSDGHRSSVSVIVWLSTLSVAGLLVAVQLLLILLNILLA